VRHSPRFPSLLVALGAALSVFVALAGCDTNDAADREDFKVFEQGTWRLGSFRVDDTDLTARLRDQYDSRLSITFYTRDEEYDRRFELYARRDQKNDRLIPGDIDISGEDDEMDVYPDSSGIGDFEVDYQILENDRIVLTTEDDEFDGLRLRNMLLPQSKVGDDFPEVRLLLTQEIQATQRQR
jgi:hypothetical protein